MLREMPATSLGHLRALIGSLRDAVLVEDARGRVVLVNEPFLRLVGEAELGAEGIGVASRLARGTRDGPAFLSRWRDVVTSGAPVIAEPIALLDGRTLERDFIPAPPGDSCGGRVWVYRDLTERSRESEALREQARAAERSNEAKGAFLATMSHEIRTPMNAILGMTELAMDASVTAEQRDQLHIVRTNADHLLHLIDDILDVSKIEAGQMSLAQVGCFVSDVCESVADAIAPRVFARNVRFVCDVDPAIPTMLVGDPHRLRQVLLNLAGNAAKFTHSGRIMLQAVASARDDASLTVTFVLSDTGVGIPDEAREKLFQRFYQVDPSLRADYGGTGLGLNISQAIVELMGGTIAVESTPGASTTFRVAIRFALADWPTPQRRLTDVGFPGCRVAILASDAETSRALVHALMSLRCEPVVLADDASLADANATLLVVDAQLGADRLRAIAGAARAAGLGGVFVVAQPAGAEREMVASIPGLVQVAAPVSRRRLAALIAERTTTVQGERPSLPPRDGSGAVRAGARVLVADDNLDNRAYVVRTLQLAGLEVVAEADGLGALARAKDERFDVIITDLEMPRLDGFGLARAVRGDEAAHARSAVPILALTAHAMSGTRERCLDAGMTAFATKPVTAAHLRQVVHRLVDPRALVLVIDDEPMNRLLVRKLLPADRFTVIEATTGADGIAMATHDRPAVVLLDLGLSDMHGTEVADRLRSGATTAGTPIVAITGFIGADVEDRLRRAGVAGYLAKPFRGAALIAAMERALGGRDAPAMPADTGRLAAEPELEPVA